MLPAVQPTIEIHIEVAVRRRVIDEIGEVLSEPAT